MFAKSVILSDAFLDMPASARSLYLVLCLAADDDGFINAVRSLIRQASASDDDLRILITKSFVISFPSGIVVISHWKIHNTVPKDRYKETIFLEEKAQLRLDQNKVYLRVIEALDTEPEQNVSRLDTQDKIGQNSINQYSVAECSGDQESGVPDSTYDNVYKEYGIFNNVLLTRQDYNALRRDFPDDFLQRIDRLSVYMESHKKEYSNHADTIRRWAIRDQDRKTPLSSRSSNPFLRMLEETDE